MADEGWAHRDLPGWHWPMFDRPAELASILHEAAPPSHGDGGGSGITG
jgi:hypothetical protein